MFGSILTDLSNTVNYVTGNLSSIITSGLRAPDALIKPVVANLINTINTILNDGVLLINNGAAAQGAILNTVLTTTNALIDTGNQVAANGSNILLNMFNRILDRLGKAIQRVNQAILGGGNVLANIRDRVRNVIQSLLDRLVPQLNTCNLKLNSLSLSSAATGMKTYSANATVIFQQLDTTLESQYKAFATLINATATEGTVYSANVTASLAQQIVDQYTLNPVRTNEFVECQYENGNMTVLVQTMINENVAMCVDAAFAQANTTTVGVEEQSTALETAAEVAVKDICKCVETVTVSSTMIQRATASTCATNALKKLSSDPIKTDADGVAASQKTALNDIYATFDQCYKDIKAQVPELQTYVEGLITGCSALN